MSTWAVIDPPLETLREADALDDVRPALDQLVTAFGANAVGRLIDVRPATISNWRRGKRNMDRPSARRILDLHYVLTRAFQTFQAETAMRWLVATDPFLDEQRPLDVLVLEGPARVVAAIDAHEAGAYP
jgi:uncharacterized protein (DUF2384 family)